MNAAVIRLPATLESLAIVQIAEPRVAPGTVKMNCAGISGDYFN